MTSYRHLLTGLLLAALLGLAGPPAADAAPNAGSGTPTKRCEGHGGGDPGDKVTVTIAISFRGRVVQTKTIQKICGQDGEWHVIL